MDYNELTQTATEADKNVRVAGIDPQQLKEQVSAKVANSAEQSLRKIINDGFRNIFKIGRKKVKGVQYLVVAVAPPEIPVADDNLKFAGMYEKDGMLMMCYKPESGDWEASNSSDKI